MTRNEESRSTTAIRILQDVATPFQINGLNSTTGNESRDLVASAANSTEDIGSPENSSQDPKSKKMGSTDSGGNAAGGQSCGLVSSLFPSNCRGRAEAFARRLHHRLTSLGGEDEEKKISGDLTPSETSWLHSGAPTSSSAHNQVLERQPRHNSDSDHLYFDFDIENDDAPGSPAEEVTVAELAALLLNPETLGSNHMDLCHCPSTARPVANHEGPESGCVFSSPVTGTSPESDSSDIYYDPESSETDKVTDPFYDVDTSESDVSSLSNGLVAKVLAHRHGSPRPEKSSKTGKRTAHEIDNDTSESCSESNCTKTRGSHDQFSCHQSFGDTEKEVPVEENAVMKRGTSSDDSLNGRSSLDTTSPSHESLWSTFDDSTVSLQDESPAKPSENLTVARGQVHKSHSDSEIPSNGSQPFIPDNAVDEVDLLREENNGKSNKNGLTNESDALMVPSNDDPDTDTDHSTYSSSLNIPGALMLLECPTGARVSSANGNLEKNEVKLLIKDDETVINGDIDKMTELLKRLGAGEEDDDDVIEEEEEQQRPQRVRRCSSLKTGKTPPGTPGRKKIVRFADVLGLDLADVRTFLDEIPKVPNSAYSDLIYDDTLIKDPPIQQSWHTKYLESQSSANSPGQKAGDKLLVPLFQQPGGLPDFLDKVRERLVCLENVVVKDPVNLSLSGTVRVRNLDFHKSVHIRYTLNGWRSFSDLQATYVNNSCDGFSDKFIFTLYCHTLNVGQRIEFAARYQCKGSQYWDNNGGTNYCFQCLPAIPSSVSYIPITANHTGCRDWGEPAFY